MDELVRSLLADQELVSFVARLVAAKLSVSGGKTAPINVVEETVEETFKSLKLLDMLQMSKDSLRSKTQKQSYGRVTSSLDTVRGSKESARIKPVGGALSSSSDGFLMKTIKTLDGSSPLQSWRHSPVALTTAPSGKPSKNLFSGMRGFTAHPSIQSHERPKSKRALSSSSTLLSRGKISRGVDDIIQNVGNADAELDAKILSSPQLKELMKRARKVPFLGNSREFQGASRSLEMGDGGEISLSDEHFLATLDAPKKGGSGGGGELRKTGGGSDSSAAGLVQGGSGIVNKKIDFGKRQRFRTAFPDFEENAEFESVDEWLKAREAFRGEEKAATLSTESIHDDSVLEDFDLALDVVERGPNYLDGSPGLPVKSVLRPKKSEEPALPSLSNCGPGVYIGSDFILDIDSPSMKRPGQLRDDADDYEDDNFEDQASEKFSENHRRRVSFKAPEVVSETHFHRSKFSPDEIPTMFYTHDEAHQFQADYSYEIYRAESLGVTWDEWWEARSQEDVEREELDEVKRQELVRSQNVEENELEEVEEDIEEEE